MQVLLSNVLVVVDDVISVSFFPRKAGTAANNFAVNLELHVR